MSATGDPPPADDAPIQTPQWVHAVAYVAVVIAILVGLAIWLLSSVVATCACTPPPS